LYVSIEVSYISFNFIIFAVIIISSSITDDSGSGISSSNIGLHVLFFVMLHHNFGDFINGTNCGNRDDAKDCVRKSGTSPALHS
jgi:hypothetical protein